jgi:hypothetical protein
MSQFHAPITRIWVKFVVFRYAGQFIHVKNVPQEERRLQVSQAFLHRTVASLKEDVQRCTTELVSISTKFLQATELIMASARWLGRRRNSCRRNGVRLSQLPIPGIAHVRSSVEAVDLKLLQPRGRWAEESTGLGREQRYEGKRNGEGDDDGMAEWLSGLRGKSQKSTSRLRARIGKVRDFSLPFPNRNRFTKSMSVSLSHISMIESPSFPYFLFVIQCFIPEHPNHGAKSEEPVQIARSFEAVDWPFLKGFGWPIDYVCEWPSFQYDRAEKRQTRAFRNMRQKTDILTWPLLLVPIFWTNQNKIFNLRRSRDLVIIMMILEL